MKNIAIMVCHKITHKCAGGGCFSAFHNRIDAFERYKDEDVNLRGFFHCNGCDKDFLEENSYKLNGMKKRNVDTIHMALCIDVECHRYEELKSDLSSQGFDVVDGSHT